MRSGWRFRNLVITALAVMVSTVMPVAEVVALDDGSGLEIRNSDVTVELEIVATFPDNSFGDAPRLNMMTTAGTRLFVIEERDGVVYELIGDTSEPRTVVEFFDVADAIETATDREMDTSNTFHGGLRSIAFHPEFPTNGLLYVSAMETRPADPSLHHYLSDVAAPISADSVLIEFTYDKTTERVDPASYREVFRVGMPVYDHPIKQIAFDTEATDDERPLLFIAHGDGSVLSAVAGGGQNNDALGKILRIDPRSSNTATYTVPADNPFVDDPSMLDEVFSLGHRNPHHLAFAEHPAGESRILIVADAGRDNVEEVNLVTAGSDYGWPQREGTFVHLEIGGRDTGIAPLPADDSTTGFVYPATQYLHSGLPGSSTTGEAIAGGYVVDNGSELSGLYFFADFPVSGELFHSRVSDLSSAVTTLTPGQSPDALSQAEIGLATVAFNHDGDDSTPELISDELATVLNESDQYESTRADIRFGQGPGGELYVMSKRNNTVYLVTNSVAPTRAPIPRYADDQILRLYRAALGRSPDSAGLRFWVDRYQSGTQLSDVAEGFIQSPEFESRYGRDPEPELLIELLFENVLGRPGDASGQAFWLDRLTSGASAASVVAAFADSTENIERTGTSAPLSSAEAKVLRLYRAALGRTPDPEGFQFWVDQFENGRSLETLAVEFRTSAEFVSRFGAGIDNGTFVALLYQNVLDRPGEASGLQFWERQLDGGMSPDAVLVQFSESPENLQRTNTQP